MRHATLLTRHLRCIALTLLLAACGGSPSASDAPLDAAAPGDDTGAPAADASAPADGATPGDAAGSDAGAADGEAGAPACGTTIAIPKTGANYYVSPQGDDGADGSSAHPWKTLQHAAGAIANGPTGVTVHVAPGDYTGGIKVSVAGTAAAPVVFTSDVIGGARVDFQGSQFGWFMGGAYQWLVGFDVKNAGQVGIIYDASHEWIVNNRVHDMVTDATHCDSNGGAAIDTDSYTVTDAHVVGNTIFAIGPNGGAACANGHSVIQGIYLATANNVVTNNLISDVSANGISSWHGATNLVIANNTVLSCHDSPILIGCGDTGCTQNHDSIVVNNLVMHTPGKPGIREEGQVANNRYIDNLLFDTGPILLVNGTATGTLTVDPKVIHDTGSVATGDYHLGSGSPAIRAGTTQSASAGDACGAPWSAAPDIGAW